MSLWKYPPGFGVVLAIAGCNGQLFISEDRGAVACVRDSECSQGRHCVSGYCMGSDCSALNPDGQCVTGRECAAGVCVPVGEAWCDCPPQQGCVDGVCVGIGEENRCSADHPRGLCEGGSAVVCVGGTCVPITGSNACSADHPRGLCPSGATCVGGACLPTAEEPCSVAQPLGRCPAGERCASGTCTATECSVADPTGVCPAGMGCQEGACKVLPCDPLHLSGLCPGGQFCASSGECLPNGTCATTGDCASGLFCSVTSACIQLGTCGGDADCGQFFGCSAGACVRDLDCTADSGCPDAEHCLSTHQCAPDGHCAIDTDCSGGKSCSSTGRCIDAGSCSVAADCDADEDCSSLGTCIPEGGCAVDADCPPANRCGSGNVCVLDGPTCTANVTSTGCSGGAFDCCPAGQSCCDPGKRCSTGVGRCLEHGECLTHADCASPSFVCSNDFECVPATPCANDGGCAASQFCSAAGGCIPDDTCVDHGDCGPGEICNGAFVCVPGNNCGAEQFQATLVQPNVLVVLDRSGSMNGTPTGYFNLGDDECLGPEDKKWTQAITAIEDLVTNYDDGVRFGLTVFPATCDAQPACGDDCDYQVCTNSSDACFSGAGTSDGPVIIPVADLQGFATAPLLFQDTLADIFPGGATPTGKALRRISSERAQHKLPDPADPVARRNYVVLITDGDANNDGASVTGCTTNSVGADDDDRRSRCKVNIALDELAKLTPTVETFVIGFAFGSVNRNLNCHAVFGRRPREDQPQCKDLKPTDFTYANCMYGNSSTQIQNAQACYYEATDGATLEAAFDTIIGKIASCSFALDQTPPDISKLFVYIDYGGTTGRVLVPRDSGATGHWTYDAATRQVTFVGGVCDDVKNATGTPVVIYGCPELGG